MSRFFPLVGVLMVASCSNHVVLNNQPVYTYAIHGTIEGKDSGWVFLGSDDTTAQSPVIIFDSAKVLGAHFHFRGRLQRPVMAKLMIRNQSGFDFYTPYFALDTGMTEAYLYRDSMAGSVISGTPVQESLNRFNQKLYNLEASFDSSFALGRAGLISQDSVGKLQDAFFRDKHDLILQQIRSRPLAVASAFVARMVLPDQPQLATLEKIYSALGHTDNYYARSLFKVLNAKRRSQVGSQVPSFTFSDITGKSFTDRSFKGKYLFLDFWASWCEPCREENPRLVDLYKKYADKAIVFVGISIDMDKRNWENAIEKDKLPWIQTCDLKGSQSDMFNDFGLYDIPANFLIDKDGKIVGKDLSVKDLEKAVSDIAVTR